MKGNCPRCKREIKYGIWFDHKKYKILWCKFCAEPHTIKNGNLIKPSKKQLDELYNDDNEMDYMDNPTWLPQFSKDDIYFRINIYDNGFYNPYHRNFDFEERKITMMYHKFGIIPQCGDIIESVEEPADNDLLDKDFVVISKQWGLDDFSECTIIVMPQNKYYEKFK